MNVRLANIRHVALDLDGTVYLGGTLFETTKPFLASLDELGIGYTFPDQQSEPGARRITWSTCAG